MSTELRVTAAYLQQLGARQEDAAAVIRAATDTADGADTSVRLTHGAISSSTAAAVTAVLNARRSAGRQTEQVSQQLHDRLDAAARSYGGTDGKLGGVLDTHMRPK